MIALYAGLGLKLASKRSGLLDAIQESWHKFLMSKTCCKQHDCSRPYGVTNTPGGDGDTLPHLQTSVRDGYVVVGWLQNTRLVSTVLPRMISGNNIPR